MKRRIIISIIGGLLSVASYAQQDPNFSLYFFNPMHYNPGYAGSRELLSGTLVHRSQWIKMPGAPVSQSLNLHSRLPDSRIGLGFQAFNDAAGPWRNTGFGGTFAYHLPMNDVAQLSFGLTGTLSNIHIDFDRISFEDQADPSFTNNADTKWVPDAAAGLYLYMPRFYAGLSATHLIQNYYHFTEADGADFARFYRHFYLTSGVVAPISENVDLRPSILLQYVQGAPLLGEIDASFIFYERFFIGAGYRTAKRIDTPGTDNIIIGMVEFEITNYLRAGYAYDYYANRNGTYNSGTHEFMLGWDISGRGNKTKIASPRFF
jgi:type IX secretion system PorP/SprF family membrane protein